MARPQDKVNVSGRARDERFDVVVIGAGVLGTAVSARLSTTTARICLLEATDDVAEGASKGNAGITSSYYAAPGTLEGDMIAASYSRWEDICKRLDVPFRRIGAVMAALTPEEADGLSGDLAGAIACGVRAQIVSGEEARSQEPLISEACVRGLLLPDEGIIDPMRLCVGFAELAARNGVVVHFDSPVIDIETHDGHIIAVSTPTRRIETSFVVNAAGLFADTISELAGGTTFRMWPRKGEYWLIDRDWGRHLRHIVFAAPLLDSKGIHVVPTTNGTALMGPSVGDSELRYDKTTDAETLAFITEKASGLVPSIPVARAIKAFAAIRPASEKKVRIEVDDKVSNLVHAINRSTGISSSLGIADRVAGLLRGAGLDLAERPDALDHIPSVRRLLLDPEPETLPQVDPRYSQVVCACEEVTAAEIQAALEMRVPARSIDGVRKRTRATAGRCQGSVCLAGVTFMCSLALKVAPGDVLITAGGHAGS